MDTVTIVAIGAVLVAAGLVAYAVRTVRHEAPKARRQAAPPAVVHARGDVVTLELTVDDPEDPAVQRLANDVARRALDHDASLEAVTVVDRAGHELTRLHRRPPTQREATIPEQLHEPSRPRRRGPDPTGGSDGGLPPLPRDVPPPHVPARHFADRFELPDTVRRLIDDPDHPAAVVRALLEAGGHAAEQHGDLVTTDEVTVALVDPTDDPEAALARAYLRVQKAAAPRGLIIRLGYADPAAIRRRDRATPHVRYTDVAAIQRMADAVAVGADPLAFAVEPTLAPGP